MSEGGMAANYEPPSDFLRAIVADEVPVGVRGFAARNLQRLIDMTQDTEVANRDWATMLLAQTDIDTGEVRQALLAAAEDENEYVRAEAILGLAQRNKALALSLIRRELVDEHVAVPVFEAAALVADPSLVDYLRKFTSPSDDPWLDELAMKALGACETGA